MVGVIEELQEKTKIMRRHEALRRFRSGVGNLFCTADRFKTEFFLRTGFQISTNVQQ